jgi:CheY-like chemotaxis protein
MKNVKTDGTSVDRCVLIIDDNEDLALSQATLLGYYGCRVEIAHDGREGLRLATHRPYHVVFIDIGLPGMSGCDVARRIRSTLADPPILLAQTAYGQPEDVLRSSEAGFDAHLVKPVDPSEIIRYVLDGREAIHRPFRFEARLPA